MLKDFKAFLLRGNVVDLAVAVVVGGAFGVVVTSLVKNMITPILGMFGGTDFSGIDIEINDSTFFVGAFLNDVIAFVTIAAAIFIFVVKPVNALMARRKTEPDVESTTRECPECLSSIPVGARRCAFCTAVVK